MGLDIKDVLFLALPSAALLAIFGVVIWAARQYFGGYPTERDLPPETLVRALPARGSLVRSGVKLRSSLGDPPRGAA